jgi:hypothetical protein
VTLTLQIHIFDDIWSEKRTEPSRRRSLPNSIIIANRFSVFQKHHHYWLLFSTKKHVIFSLGNNKSHFLPSSISKQNKYRHVSQFFMIPSRLSLPSSHSVRSFLENKKGYLFQKSISKAAMKSKKKITTMTRRFKLKNHCPCHSIWPDVIFVLTPLGKLPVNPFFEIIFLNRTIRSPTQTTIPSSNEFT